MTTLKMGSTMQENQPPSTMHNGRQRLRPFLISLIDSGKVKGLQWLDKEKTLFKIPWKHAGKQDYDPQEDSKIFMLWSRNTGKYKEGIHEPEPAVWKTRLRTALNKLPDIEEVHEKTQLDIPEPYRVYKLLPKKNGGSSSNAGKAPDYHTTPGRQAIRATGANLRGYHASAGSYTGMVTDCPEIPHPSYPSHYPSIYDHYTYQNSVCDVSSMGHYPGFSPTNSGYNYFSHPQQPVLSPRHHPYPIGQRPHHNSSSSNGSSVDDLGAITEVINDDVMSSNIIDHHVHNYTNMDNMDVDLQQQQQQHQHQQQQAQVVAQLATKGLESGAGMHQYLNNNNNDPSQMNYHDPTSVTSSGMTVPYNSPPTGAVPLRSHNASRDYEQHPSPPSAMNAITIASNVLSGEDEGLEACTATAAMSGLCRRPSIKEESYCLPAEHEMSIQLYYRSCDAGYHHVNAEGGCMLYFREPFEVKRNVQLIQLPDIKDIPEEEVKGKPREYIGKILDCCDKGLSLTCRDGCIYVKRHCRSVLFWSTSEDLSTSEKLERDIETKLFDLDRFRHRLRQYYEGAGPSPTVPEIHFSIAQKLTDAFPLRACFISFVVRPLRALEELRTINSEARSLPHSSHSGLLKFSGPEMHTESMMSHTISAGLSAWGDISSAYAASCPMVPQPAAMQVN